MSYIEEEDFRQSLRRGNVFYMKGKIDTERKHYQVLLNDITNHEDDILFLSIATSQIDKRKKYIDIQGYNPDTLVIIDQGEVPFFYKRTCFDCNQITQYSLYDLYGDYCEDKCSMKGKLPEDIVDKILNGILISKNVSTRTKKLIGLM